MIDVVVDKSLLCGTDCLFDRMQLLRDIEAGTLSFDHVDDGAQVSLGALQALDDFRVTLMKFRFDHLCILSYPPGEDHVGEYSQALGTADSRHAGSTATRSWWRSRASSPALCGPLRNTSSPFD